MNEFALRDLFILGHGLRNFLAASSTTMESLPLKERDFVLQRPTGPSFRSSSLYTFGLLKIGLPGMSLAEICATCLDMSMWSFSGGVKCCS